MQPIDRDEVRQLPKEQHAKKKPCFPAKTAAGTDPTDQRRNRTGNRTDQRVRRMDAFERRVNKHINRNGCGGEISGEVANLYREVDDADRRQDPSNAEGRQGIHAARGQRAIGGALHARVEINLHELVESGGAKRRGGRSEKRVQQLHPIEGHPARGKNEAEEGRDEHENVEPHLHQHDEITAEVVGLRAGAFDLGIISRLIGCIHVHPPMMPMPAAFPIFSRQRTATPATMAKSHCHRPRARTE